MAQVRQLERKIVRVARGQPEEPAHGGEALGRAVADLTGRLTAAQRELIASRVKSIPVYVDERLGERSFRQGAFLELARAKPAREVAIAGLQRLLVDTDSWRRAEYQHKLRERDEQLFEMISALSATLSADQRAHSRTACAASCATSRS